MMEEGIYSLSYRGDTPGEDERDDALAVLRDGQILGSDRWGGLFTGSYEFDPIRQRGTVRVNLHVPPGGILVNGYVAGPDGSSVDLVATLEPPAPVSLTTVELNGRPLRLELTYIGPLPN